MTVLKSLLSSFRNSRNSTRKSRRAELVGQVTTEALEQRLLLTNPDPFDSNPGAAKTIYLDFDGHTENSNAWTGGAAAIVTPNFSADGDRTTFSDFDRTTIEEIYRRVSEDFAPFENVRVTTILPATTNPGDVIFVSIGGNGSWTSRPFNEALTNGFTSTTSSNTVFVFPDDYGTGMFLDPQLGRRVANGVSEAVGIAMGLGEPARPSTAARSALVGGAPVANGWRDVWSDQVGQDDLSIMTNSTNGFIFRGDDHGDSFANATSVATTPNTETLGGFIEEVGDVDFFHFNTAGTTATITVQGIDLTADVATWNSSPFSGIGVVNAGTNLDPSLTLFDANGNQIGFDNPGFDGTTPATANASLVASITATLPSGEYYLRVSTGSEYGNLGQYTLSIGGVDQTTSIDVPPLQSNPNAPVNFFLDFNGARATEDEIIQARADGLEQPFFIPAYDTDGDRTTFSAQEQADIVEIYRRVAEDFAPFDVNVTTVDPFLYDARVGLQVVIGGDGSWHGVPTATGFAAFDTFGNGLGDNMAIAFSELFLGDKKETALETSAAISNALGIETHLEFDAGGNPTGNRLPGFPAYGAIGGDSVNSLRDIFQNVAGSSSVLPIDPLAIITGNSNRIRFRPDDHGNNSATASLITLSTNDEVLTGIIETNNDFDVFSFETKASPNATFTIKGLDLRFSDTGAPVAGVTNPGANLDPFIELLDENLVVLAADGEFFTSIGQLQNDGTIGSLSATITLPLASGRYFLRVGGQRSATLLEYGNIGTYSITIEGVDGTDVSLSFLPNPNTGDVAISENEGTVVGIGRVDRPRGQPITSDLIIELESTDTSELTVPATVTIPRGQTFALFNVTAVDDDLLDGEQRVVVNAKVNGQVSSSAILRVLDHETISVSVDPNPVKEDAGAAGATLTVSRSNTDIGEVNHWVSAGSSLFEYDVNGMLVRTVPIEWPTGSRPLVEIAHDVQVLQDGNVAVFNGTGTAFLSIFNVTTNSWTHFAEPGLSANTTADPTIGGIAAIGDYVFLSDFESFDGDARGIVRVNTFTGAVDRFADSSVGSRLFVANGANIQEVEPITGDILRIIPLPINTVGVTRTAQAVAFDGASLWVLIDDNTFGTTVELLKISPDTGALLETHNVPGTFSLFNSGMTVMNGLIYITDDFNATFGGTSLLTYNPTVRQVLGAQIPIEAQNNIIIGNSIGALPSENRILVTGFPNTVFGIFNERIYEIDPVTGFVTSSFAVPGGLNLFADGITSVSDVSIGGTTYDNLIYLNGNLGGIRVFERNGTELDVNPLTSPVDPVPNTGYSPFNDIGGGDVPGVTSQDQSFRDVTIGLQDGLLYGLLDTGNGIAVHDPETLAQVNTITLDTVVNAISIDRDGNILGGSPNGIVTLFTPAGVTISSISTGLASIADIDTNVSEALIISDINGQVVTGPLDAVRNSDVSMLRMLELTNAPSFVSFGRHSTLPTGDLFITLTSDDLSELSVPIEVRIPVGQPSVAIPIDVIDDNLRDGTQFVNIAGASDNYVSVPGIVAVLDAETVGVEIIPATALETDGTYTDGIRVFRTDVDGPFEVPDFSTASTVGTLAIVDNDVTLSQLEIRNQQSIITDVNVTISLQHSFIPDLDVYLVSPSGTRVALFTDLGTNETAMTNTVFDDEAATRIVDGSAPYTGRFIARGLLSAFDGQDPSGIWTLEISDDNVRDAGTLLGWTLDIETLGLPETNVVLFVSDATEATVTQITVTIPAATAEVFIDLSVLDDTIVDGTQTATIGVTSTDQTGFDLGSDSIDVLDVENLLITFDRTTVSEGDGPGAILGTVSRSDSDMLTDLIVTLTSNDTSEIAVDVTVTIPAGQQSATFPVDAVDDPDFDGDQQTTITATAPGYVPFSSPTITITDQEPRVALTTLSTTVAEDAGTILITISRLDASDLSVAQTVTLQSNDLTELLVPATFVIPINAISTNFVATVLPDDLLDGPQTVTITAADINTANPSVNSGSLQITVEDAEAVQITVPSGGSSFFENAGAAVTATVTLTAPNPAGDTVVTLSNSDLTEVSIPAQVIVPAGETSVTFTIRAVDDTAIDRDQLVTLTGTAAGYRDGSLVVTVKDYEPPVTIGPASTTVDSTPAIQWAPVEGATRYDLWVNDVSRNIVQLYRLENLPAAAPFFYETFESQSFATNGWTNSGATIDDLALGEQGGSYSAHLNGGPTGTDRLDSATIDLSGRVGVQLKYAFQQTGSGDSPEASEDLVVSYRNAAGQWIAIQRQLGSGPDTTVFSTSTIQLPAAALHANFALRFESIGKTTQDGVVGEYDDWFIDNIELSELEQFVPPQELGVGRYRYWVRAYDNLEQPGFWSRGHDFLVRTSPVFISPTNQSPAAVSGSPVISWTTVVDSDYDLWVNDLTRGTSQVIRRTGLQTTSFATATENLPGGTYRAWVRAGAPDGVQGFWSQPVTFTILAAPTGLRPTGATFDRTPELGWDAVEGAEYYYVWLTRRNPGQPAVVVLQDQLVTGTVRIPDQDLEDGRYALWVQAIGEDGSRSAWSAVSEFNIAGRPQIINPAENDTVSSRPTITWTGVDGSSHYEIWVNRIDVPTTRVLYDNNVNSTTYTAPSALAAGTYRVWIRAISEMGERSPWSRPVNFTVASVDTNSFDLESNSGPQLASIPAGIRLQNTYVVMPLEEDSVASVDTEKLQPTIVDVDGRSIESNPATEDAQIESVDTVMSDWDASTWWDGASTVNQEQQEFSQAASLLGLGLAAGRSIVRTSRKKQNS